MARGGYRPGAGRPSKTIRSKVVSVSEIKRSAEKTTPLEYMLAVMNDPEADLSRRDRMAIAAAPYTHTKAGDDIGKKEAQRVASDEAAEGTSWSDLVH